MSFCMCGQSSRVFCPYRENFHFSFIFSCLLDFLEHAGRPLMTLTYAVLSCIISHLHEICFSGAADHSPVFFLPFPAAYISVAREKGRKCVRGWSNYCRFPCLCSSYFFFFNSFSIRRKILRRVLITQDRDEDEQLYIQDWNIVRYAPTPLTFECVYQRHYL